MSAVGFLTEANGQIGYGHLYRSIALAQEFQRKKYDITFFLDDRASEDIVIKQVPSAEIFSTDFLDYRVGGAGKNLDYLIIDMFHKNLARYDFLEREQGSVTAVVIDDMFYGYALKTDFAFRVGYQDYKRKEEVLEIKSGRVVRTFSGTDFIILRSEFRKNMQYVCRPYADKILVTMGGSDPYYLTELIVNALQIITIPLQITHVFGSGFSEKRIDEIGSAYEGSIHTVVHRQNVCDMASLMVANDFAVINGGNTRFELAMMGVPFLSVSFNEKQNAISENISKAGLGRNLGVFSNQSPSYLKAEIMKFAGDYSLRESMSRRMNAVMQQNGASNVCNEIANISSG